MDLKYSDFFNNNDELKEIVKISVNDSVKTIYPNLIRELLLQWQHYRSLLVDSQSNFLFPDPGNTSISFRVYRYQKGCLRYGQLEEKTLDTSIARRSGALLIYKECKDLRYANECLSIKYFSKKNILNDLGIRNYTNKKTKLKDEDIYQKAFEGMNQLRLF